MVCPKEKLGKREQTTLSVKGDEDGVDDDGRKDDLDVGI